MRYLFVFEGDEKSAKGVVNASGVTDVEVIAVPKGQRSAPQWVLDLLAQTPDEQSAYCGVIKPYIKSLGNVSWGYQAKEYRRDDMQLAAWLVPLAELAAQTSKPSQAFFDAAAKYPRLLLFPKSLDKADDISPLRWKFVARAADLLGRLAGGEDVGSPREWWSKHGVITAHGGQVLFDYTLRRQGKKYAKTRWGWHMKEGDAATLDKCARIYFDVCHVDDFNVVLVFYVGPHPEDDTYTVELHA